MIAREETREPVAGIGLRGGERRQQAVEVGRRRANGNARPFTTGRDERRRPAAGGVCLHDRACCTNRRVEGRLRRSPDLAAPVAVEDHDDAVVGRVLELLHHQLAAPRARRPVDAPKRLALLVLTDGVEVEPCGAPEQDAPAVADRAPTVAEQPVECRKPRTDDDRASLGGDPRGDRQEAEEVTQDDAGLGKRVDAAWQPAELDPPRSRPSVSRETTRARAEASDRHLDRHRPERHTRAAPDVEVELNAIAFCRRIRLDDTADDDRAVDEPRPEPCERARQEEADPDNAEHARTRRDGGDQRHYPERQTASLEAHRPDPADERGGVWGTGRFPRFSGRRGHAGETLVSPATASPGRAGHLGTGASASARSTASSPRIPDARASGARMTRCARTAVATAWTSSGTT